MRIVVVWITVLVAYACGPSTPQHDAATGSGDPRLDSAVVTGDDAASGPDAMVMCSVHDGDCGPGSYLHACGGGQCFQEGCCCPTERECRSGSFPVCCDEGMVCKDTATGACGPP